MMENCSRFYEATVEAKLGIHDFADVERITRLIRGMNYGYTSFFDLGKRFMQVYRRTDYQNAYNFNLPQ
jgi:hypothetical protein